MLCKQTLVGPERSRQLICGSFSFSAFSCHCCYCGAHHSLCEHHQDATLVWNRGSHLQIQSSSNFFTQDSSSVSSRTALGLPTYDSSPTWDAPPPPPRPPSPTSLPTFSSSCPLLSAGLREVQPTFSRVRSIQRIRRPSLFSISKQKLGDKQKDRLLLLPWRGDSLQVLVFCEETRRFFLEESIPVSAAFHAVSSSSSSSSPFPGCDFCSTQRSAFFLPSSRPPVVTEKTSTSNGKRVISSSRCGYTSQASGHSILLHSRKKDSSDALRGRACSAFSSKNLVALPDEGIFAVVVDAGKGWILVGCLGGEETSRGGGDEKTGRREEKDDLEEPARPDKHMRKTRNAPERIRHSQQSELREPQVIPLRLCGTVRHIELLRLFDSQSKGGEDRRDEETSREPQQVVEERRTGKTETFLEKNQEGGGGGGEQEREREGVCSCGVEITQSGERTSGVCLHDESPANCGVFKKRRREEKEFRSSVIPSSESDRGGGGGGEHSLQEKEERTDEEQDREQDGDSANQQRGREANCLLALREQRRQRRKRRTEGCPSSSKGRAEKRPDQDSPPVVVLAVILESRETHVLVRRRPVLSLRPVESVAMAQSSSSSSSSNLRHSLLLFRVVFSAKKGGGKGPSSGHTGPGLLCDALLPALDKRPGLSLCLGVQGACIELLPAPPLEKENLQAPPSCISSLLFSVTVGSCPSSASVLAVSSAYGLSVFEVSIPSSDRAGSASSQERGGRLVVSDGVTAPAVTESESSTALGVREICSHGGEEQRSSTKEAADKSQRGEGADTRARGAQAKFHEDEDKRRRRAREKECSPFHRQTVCLQGGPRGICQYRGISCRHVCHVPWTSALCGTPQSSPAISSSISAAPPPLPPRVRILHRLCDGFCSPSASFEDASRCARASCCPAFPSTGSTSGLLPCPSCGWRLKWQESNPCKPSPSSSLPFVRPSSTSSASLTSSPSSPSSRSAGFLPSPPAVRTSDSSSRLVSCPPQFLCRLDLPPKNQASSLSSSRFLWLLYDSRSSGFLLLTLSQTQDRQMACDLRHLPDVWGSTDTSGRSGEAKDFGKQPSLGEARPVVRDVIPLLFREDSRCCSRCPFFTCSPCVSSAPSPLEGPSVSRLSAKPFPSAFARLPPPAGGGGATSASCSSSSPHSSDPPSLGGGTGPRTGFSTTSGLSKEAFEQSPHSCAAFSEARKVQDSRAVSENPHVCVSLTKGKEISWLLVALVERGSDWILRLTCEDFGVSSSECWRLRAVRCLYTRTHLTDAVCLPDIVVPSSGNSSSPELPTELSFPLLQRGTNVDSDVVLCKANDTEQHSIEERDAWVPQFREDDSVFSKTAHPHACLSGRSQVDLPYADVHPRLLRRGSLCMPAVQNAEGWGRVYAIGGRWPTSTLYELQAGYRLSARTVALPGETSLCRPARSISDPCIHQWSETCLGAWVLPRFMESPVMVRADEVSSRNEVGSRDDRVERIHEEDQLVFRERACEKQERQNRAEVSGQNMQPEGPQSEDHSTVRHAEAQAGQDRQGEQDWHGEQQSKYERGGISLPREKLPKTEGHLHLVETYEDRTEIFLLGESGAKVGTLREQEILVEASGRSPECGLHIPKTGSTQGSSLPAGTFPREGGESKALSDRRYQRWGGLRIRADVRSLFIEPFVFYLARLQKSYTGVIQVVRDGVYVHLASVSASFWWPVEQLRVPLTDCGATQSSRAYGTRVVFSPEVIGHRGGTYRDAKGRGCEGIFGEAQAIDQTKEISGAVLSEEEEFILSGGGAGLRLWLITSSGDLVTFRLRCTDTSAALVRLPCLQLRQYFKSVPFGLTEGFLSRRSPSTAEDTRCALVSSLSSSNQNHATNQEARVDSAWRCLQRDMSVSLITAVVVAPCSSVSLDAGRCLKQPGGGTGTLPVDSERGRRLSALASSERREDDLIRSSVEKDETILLNGCRGHLKRRISQVYVWGVAYDNGYVLVEFDYDAWQDADEEEVVGGEHGQETADPAEAEAESSVRRALPRKTNRSVWVGCPGLHHAVHTMSVCASHLIVGTRGGMLLAYSLEFLLFGSSSSSLDVPLSSSAIPLINEDQKTHNSSSSCLVSFRALPSPVWKCQLGILPLFLSPIKHVRTDEQGNHSRPGTPASAHHGCLVRHGVWGGELHTRSGEWFLLLSDGQEEKATSEASVNGFFSSISSNAAEKVEPEDGYERKTASKQGDSTFSNKDAPEQNQVGVKLLRGGRFGQSKDVREPSDLNPVLDGTALLPLLGGSSRAKNMCPTSHSTSCISSSCTFRCLPLVSHPVLSSAVPVVSRSRQPSSESRSSADDTSCSFTQSIRSAPSASSSPRPHQPAEALWAVAWVKEDEDDGGTSLLVSDANSEGLRRTPREQGKSPPLRMLCFYPPSYSTSRALWDVETSSGLHVTRAVRLPFVANLIAAHPQSPLLAIVGRTPSQLIPSSASSSSSAKATHLRQPSAEMSCPGAFAVFICGNVSALSPSPGSAVVSSSASVPQLGCSSSTVSQGVVASCPPEVLDTPRNSYPERIDLDFGLLGLASLSDVSELPYAADTVLSSWQGEAFVNQGERVFAPLHVACSKKSSCVLRPSCSASSPPSKSSASSLSSDLRIEPLGSIQPQCVCFWQPAPLALSCSSSFSPSAASRDTFNGARRRTSKTRNRRSLGSLYTVSSSPFLILLSPVERRKVRRCLRTLLPHLSRDNRTLSSRDLRLLIRLLGRPESPPRYCRQQLGSFLPCFRSSCSSPCLVPSNARSARNLRRRLAATLAAAPSAEWRAEDMRWAYIRRLQQAEQLIRDRLEFCRLEERRRTLQREFFREEARQHRALRRRILLRERARRGSALPHRGSHRDRVEGEPVQQAGRSERLADQEIQETERVLPSTMPVDTQAELQGGGLVPRGNGDEERSSMSSEGQYGSSTSQREPSHRPSLAGEREEDPVTTEPLRLPPGEGAEEVAEREASGGAGGDSGGILGAGRAGPGQGAERGRNEITADDSREGETEVLGRAGEGGSGEHVERDNTMRAAGEEFSSPTTAREEEMQEAFFSAQEGEEESEEPPPSGSPRRTGASEDRAGQHVQGEEGGREERWGWLEITALATGRTEGSLAEQEQRGQQAELEKLLSEIRERLRRAEEEDDDPGEGEDQVEEVGESTEKQRDEEESEEDRISEEGFTGGQGSSEELQSGLLLAVGGHCDPVFVHRRDADKDTPEHLGLSNSPQLSPGRAETEELSGRMGADLSSLGMRCPQLPVGTSSCRPRGSAFSASSAPPPPLTKHRGCLVLFKVQVRSASRSEGDERSRTRGEDKEETEDLGRGHADRGVETTEKSIETNREDEGDSGSKGTCGETRRDNAVQAAAYSGGNEGMVGGKVADRRGDGEEEKEGVTVGEVTRGGSGGAGRDEAQRKTGRCLSDRGKQVSQQADVTAEQSAAASRSTLLVHRVHRGATGCNTKFLRVCGVLSHFCLSHPPSSSFSFVPSGREESGAETPGGEDGPTLLLRTVCVHLLPFPVEAVVPFLAGRFLAVGGAASVALLELTHVPSVGDLSRAGDGQEGVKETGQEETQEEQRSRATRQAKSRAPQLTGAAGHRLTLQPVATFTLGDRNNSQISGLSPSPLDDHLLTVTMRNPTERSCGRILLLRWDETSQQLLGVATGEDEDNRGYQTAGITLIEGGTGEDEEVVRSYEVSVSGSSASSPAVSVVNLSPGTGSFEPHADFSLSSPALQVLPTRPRIAFSSSFVPYIEARRAMQSSPWDVGGAKTAAWVREEGCNLSSSTSVLIPCLDGSVTSVFSLPRRMRLSSAVADSPVPLLPFSPSSAADICADLCLFFKLLQSGLTASASSAQSRFLPGSSSACVSPSSALFACSLRQQHLLWLLWRRFESARLIPTYSCPSIAAHRLLEAQVEGLLRLKKIVGECSKMIERLVDHTAGCVPVKEDISEADSGLQGGFKREGKETKKNSAAAGPGSERRAEGRRRGSGAPAEEQDTEEELIFLESLKDEIMKLKESWENGSSLLDSKMQHSRRVVSAHFGSSSLATSHCSLATVSPSPSCSCSSSSAVPQHPRSLSTSSSRSTWRPVALWLERQAKHILSLLQISSSRKTMLRGASSRTENDLRGTTAREPGGSRFLSSSSFSLVAKLREGFTRLVSLSTEALKRVSQLEDIQLQYRCWTRLHKDSVLLHTTQGEADQRAFADYFLGGRHESKERQVGSSPETTERQSQDEPEAHQELSPASETPASKVLLQLHQESYSLLSALYDELKRHEKSACEKAATAEDQRREEKKTETWRSGSSAFIPSKLPEGALRPTEAKPDGLGTYGRRGRKEEKKEGDDTEAMAVARRSLLGRLEWVLKKQSYTFAVGSETLVGDDEGDQGELHGVSSSAPMQGQSRDRQEATAQNNGGVGELAEVDGGEGDSHEDAKRSSSSFLSTSESGVLGQLRELQREMEAARAFLSQSGRLGGAREEQQESRRGPPLGPELEQEDDTRRDSEKEGVYEEKEGSSLLVEELAEGAPLLADTAEALEDRPLRKEPTDLRCPGGEDPENDPVKKGSREGKWKMKEADQFSDVSLDIEEIVSLEGSSFETLPSEAEDDSRGESEDEKATGNLGRHGRGGGGGGSRAKSREGERRRSAKTKTIPRSRCDEEGKDEACHLERKSGSVLSSYNSDQIESSRNKSLLEEETERRIKRILKACRQNRKYLERCPDEEPPLLSSMCPSLPCRGDDWEQKLASTRCLERRRKSIQDFLYDDYRLVSACRDYLPSLLPPRRLPFHRQKQRQLSHREKSSRADEMQDLSTAQEETLRGWRKINQARLRSGGSLAFWWYCTTLASSVNSPTSLFHLRREIFICGKEGLYECDDPSGREARTDRRDSQPSLLEGRGEGGSHAGKEKEEDAESSSAGLRMNGETWSRDNRAVQRRLGREDGFWRDEQVSPEDGLGEDACSDQERTPRGTRGDGDQEEGETDERLVMARQRRMSRSGEEGGTDEDDDDEDDLPPPEAWSLFWGSDTEDATVRPRKTKRRRRTRRATTSSTSREEIQRPPLSAPPCDSSRRGSPAYSSLPSQEKGLHHHALGSQRAERISGSGNKENDTTTRLPLSSLKVSSTDSRLKGKKSSGTGGETCMIIDMDLVSVVTRLSPDAERELEELLPLLPSEPSSVDECRRAFSQLALVSSL